MLLKGLYVITDERLTPYENEEIFKKVEEALKGGAKIIQLRDKTHSDDFLIPYAKELKKLCRMYQAFFIINDRIELAIKVDADGIHLGKDDFSPEKACKMLKNKIIGVSCYDDLEKAKYMESLGVNYVAFGSFYPSPTKPESKVISKEILVQAKKVLKIPVCAIGGINAERAKELVALGADMIAVISDIWNAQDIKKRAEEYSNLFL